MDSDLQPATALWARYRPDEAPYRFHATTPGEARRWQADTRSALARQLGVDSLVAAPLDPQPLARVDKGDYVREKWLLRTTPHTLMPIYLLLPKAAPRPSPVVVAFHGHGAGAVDLIGLTDLGRDRPTPAGLHQDFAITLCRAGFAVAVPEVSCFGERQTDFGTLDAALNQPEPTTCAHTAMLALHLGISAVGLRVFDGMRLVDYLTTRPELDTARLGAMGFSGGGMHAFFSTCIDPRIRAAVVSGYFSTFRDSILAMAHCPCNFVPGLAAFGEMADLAGLIAPRPLLVEAGKQDGLFPISAVEAGVTAAKKAYACFEAQAHLQTDFFEGGHEVNGREAAGFLRRWLG